MFRGNNTQEWIIGINFFKDKAIGYDYDADRLSTDVFVFIYFSYAFIIKFDTSMMITLSNYLVKSIVTVIYLLVVNKMFEVKKVK